MHTHTFKVSNPRPVELDVRKSLKRELAIKAHYLSGILLDPELVTFLRDGSFV